jgi:ribonuclease P/MRP protein subunit RPP40
MELHINSTGILKLLQNINCKKECGPDAIPNIFLKETATEIAPFLSDLFSQSLATGELPDDWVNANVTPVFKKGSRHDPANYRPVSLTSVCCKILEHIISRHILSHLEKHNILTSLQHGFRSGHSCESQLLLTMHDITASFDKKNQVDIAILDFSKAFDTVPHKRLLAKLDHYGITGPIHGWIKGFLTNRQQKVMVNGTDSDQVSVDSGVPQGTVLGPLLFLCHINDLPTKVKSSVRLFADDCLLYREINSVEDHIALQEDLSSLERWADMWGMRFNPTKCYVMKTGRRRSLGNWLYTLCDHPLEIVKTNPYLGLTLSEDLKWGAHINKITKKASATLGFLRRNLNSCPAPLREVAYSSLVRTNLEYSSPVWDPYLKSDITKLEAVQRRAARFVMNDFRRESSVSSMLQTLNWRPLSSRRRDARLVLLFKIIHRLVAVPCEGHIQQNQSRTRSNNSYRLKVYSPQTEIFRNSFFPRTIPQWNKLTDKVIATEDPDTFKINLSNFY